MGLLISMEIIMKPNDLTPDKEYVFFGVSLWFIQAEPPFGDYAFRDILGNTMYLDEEEVYNLVEKED